MNTFSFAGLTLACSCFIVTILILVFGRTKVQQLWGLFNISVGLWGISAFFLGRITDPHLALVVWRIAHIPIIFISVFLFHFVYKLCDLKNKKLLYFAYCQGIIFSILALTSKYFISNVYFVFNSFYYDVAGLLFHPFFAIWGFLVTYSHFQLTKTFFNSSGLLRKQILYLLIGSLLGFLGGITNFLPALKINIYPFGNFTIPIYCFIASYAILKYRLLDINAVFTRAGIFIGIYSLVLGIPFALAFGWQSRLIDLFGLRWWIVPLVSSTVLATVGPFVYLYIQNKAENRMLREQRNYQNILRGASSGMIRVKDLSRLLNLVVHVITKTVRIKHALVYLFDQENNRYVLQASRSLDSISEGNKIIEADSPLILWLSKHKEPIVGEEIAMRAKETEQDILLNNFAKQLSDLKAALVVPSFVEEKLIALLILGEKKSGKLYSSDDLVVFSVLANQAALAIENAQFYDEVKRTHQQLFQAEKMATIGTMADGLSHQINNRFHALSLIAGDTLDMMRTTNWPDCGQEIKTTIDGVRLALEKIEANVLQGGEVVKGLLKYSRPGDGGFESIDFHDVLNGAIDMVQYKIKLKEIDLIKNIPDNLSKIHGNLAQLQEVFFNMVDNAYDAIKERQLMLKEESHRGKIEISAVNEDGVIQIKVSDNGMGIKDLDKKKLFTPFFTTKATTRKGTGLGLYVIEKIIASHNGTIRIGSIYQRGTEFNIMLPTKAVSKS